MAIKRLSVYKSKYVHKIASWEVQCMHSLIGYHRSARHLEHIDIQQ